MNLSYTLYTFELCLMEKKKKRKKKGGRRRRRKKKKNEIGIFTFDFLDCEDKSGDSGAISRGTVVSLK